MKVLAIDPGNEQSAFIIWDGKVIYDKGILPNYDILTLIGCDLLGIPKLAIEMIASYGMPVGKTVFETCVWIGRFIECYESNVLTHKYDLVYRKDVKMHLCGTTRAKDGNIRQALIDRFGEPGTKKNPGVLYGVKKDIWAALAVGVYYLDNKNG